jgi:acyl dehydratase
MNETPAVGESRSAVVVEGLTRTQIVQYAGASGDFNPLHTDEVYATQVTGFPSVFAHGMLTMGLSARVVTDWFGPAKVRKIGVSFRQQVWPGDSLTTTATVTSVSDSEINLELVTVNQRGETVLRGDVTVAG